MLGAHSVHQILHHVSHLPEGQYAPFRSAVLQSNAIVYEIYHIFTLFHPNYAIIDLPRRHRKSSSLNLPLFALLSLSTRLLRMHYPLSKTLSRLHGKPSFLPSMMRNLVRMEFSADVSMALGFPPLQNLWHGNVLARLRPVCVV